MSWFIRRHSIALGLALLTGIVVYVATERYYENLITQFHPLYAVQTTYAFLQPLIGISTPSDARQSLGNVKESIEATVKEEPAGVLARYAVYFRDFKTATWTGVNENDEFDPASLLKVVAAIAVFRQEEDEPGYGSLPLTYTSDIAQINHALPFAQPTKLVVGQSYSIPYLIKAELADSDNGAVYLLLSSLKDSEIDSVYQGLTIPKPSDTSSVGYKISPLDYARFLRILYNGTYNLTWAHTNEILQDLSESTFTAGLVAGVPGGTPVAHKYGQHINTSGGTISSVELNDCGIVYYPARPYLLCVMTEGHDPTALAKVIADISKSVYQKVIGNYE